MSARAILVALAVGASCATAGKPIPRTGPPPAAEALLAALRARHEALRTLEIETRTTSWLGGERVRATVLMRVERGGRLFFTAEAALQGTVASLAVAEGRFALLDVEQKVFRRGPACPENVASLVRIPLHPEEIAAVLLGDAPAGPRARALGVGWDERRGTDILELERPAAGAAATRLWITLRATVGAAEVLAVEGQSPGAPGRWRVSYEDLERAQGIPLPRRIRFAEPGRSFDQGVEIRVNERLSVNRPLDDEAFALAPPAGYPVEEVLCEERR